MKVLPILEMWHLSTKKDEKVTLEPRQELWSPLIALNIEMTIPKLAFFQYYNLITLPPLAFMQDFKSPFVLRYD